MPSRFYYDTGTGIPAAPIWTEELQWAKIRIIDTIQCPIFLEIWIADPNNTKQSAGTFQAYQRIKIDYTYQGVTSTTFYGRIEYIEPRYDEGSAQVIVIQAKDALQELQNRKLDFDFTDPTYGAVTNSAQLVDKLVQYCIYTEITYNTLAGGNFTVASGANSGYYITIDCGGGNLAWGSIIYDDVANTIIVVDHLVNEDLTNQVTAGDVITEYDGTGVVTGVTAVFGSLYRNIDTSVLDALVVAGGTSPVTGLGYYAGNTKSGLDAIQEVSNQDNSGGIYIYDFFVNNSAIPQFDYFLRGARDSDLTISYGVSETDVIKPMFESYEFPVSVREGATHIIAGGVDADGYLQRYTMLSGVGAGLATGRIAYNLKTFKDDVVIQKAQSAIVDLAILAQAEEKKIGGTDIQRGTVPIVGYPMNYTSGAVMRAGQIVLILNAKVASVNNTHMLVVEIDYEEPPGITTIELLGQARGKAKRSTEVIQSLSGMQRKADEGSAQTLGYFLLPGTGGVGPNNIKWGLDVTDAAGLKLVTHGRPDTPNAIFATPLAGGDLICNMGAFGPALIVNIQRVNPAPPPSLIAPGITWFTWLALW